MRYCTTPVTLTPLPGGGADALTFTVVVVAVLSAGAPRATPVPSPYEYVTAAEYTLARDWVRAVTLCSPVPAGTATVVVVLVPGVTAMLIAAPPSMLYRSQPASEAPPVPGVVMVHGVVAPPGRVEVQDPLG